MQVRVCEAVCHRVHPGIAVGTGTKMVRGMAFRIYLFSEGSCVAGSRTARFKNLKDQ